ncbi:hypothetical protein HY837_01170 [archaeon]|nr:hypothetical protein [archaeon]
MENRKVAAIKPASDADLPMRLTLSEELQTGSVEEIVKFAVEGRNIPRRDRDMADRIKTEMTKDFGYTLNGKAVQGSYQMKEADFVETTTPNKEITYKEATIIVAAKQTQGYN